ncbi:MAG: TRAP transporter substrate-binding protein DctP [Spirochaetaceae bacterium]|jgi:TRAP-type C4-dicarboxylate transport system substrate-binding protein|nr:TRAP transporter substrate-binding protein DctP [Spirochaetaceae bacterium]
MKKQFIFSLIFAAALILVMPVYGQRRQQQKVVIKLASMVPANTEWGRMVTKLSAEWKKATNDEVQLLVFADGTQGSEEEVLRKLNMNTIQAAVLTSFGLVKIVPEILTISCPFMFRNDAELDEVLKTVKVDFEAKINSKNYFALTLVKGGWVKFFSRSPVIVPADLKKQRIGSNPSEPELIRAFRAMGYQVVEVDNSRALLALNGGTIDAIYMSPIFTAGAQYFGVAKNMASINVAPFMGGIVLNKHAWESIPAQHRDALIAVTRRISVEMETSLLKLEADTIRMMKNNGLIENQVNAQQMEEWYSDMAKALPGLLGTTFDRAMYNKIDGIIKTYRSRQ